MIANKRYNTSESCKRCTKISKGTVFSHNICLISEALSSTRLPIYLLFTFLVSSPQSKRKDALRKEAFDARALDQDWTGEKEPNAIQSEWSLFSLVFWSCRGILCRKCRCAFSKDKCRTLATAIQTKVPETRSKGKGDSLSARTIRYVMRHGWLRRPIKRHPSQGNRSRTQVEKIGIYRKTERGTTASKCKGSEAKVEASFRFASHCRNCSHRIRTRPRPVDPSQDKSRNTQLNRTRPWFSPHRKEIRGGHGHAEMMPVISERQARRRRARNAARFSSPR